MHGELNRRLIIVSGKGGVGKSTVAATLAYSSAAGGVRTLLARADPQDRVWHLFDSTNAEESDFLQNAMPNLDIVDIRPEAALREYGSMVLHSKRLYAAVFENRLVASFLRGTPGVHAWATLGKVCFHVNPQMVGGNHNSALEYERVVFDAPATGHLLDMVRVPVVIHNTASGGLLRRGAEGALEVLRDPEKTCWLVASTAEPFSLREAADLRRALVQEFPSQAPVALLNQAETERITGPLLTLASALPRARPEVNYAHLVRRVLRREQEQQNGLRWLEEVFARVLKLPYMATPLAASTLADSLNNGEHSVRERGPT